MSNYLALYRQYLQSINPALDGEFLIAENLSTNWDEPETALDFHNCAVMALIEAENSPMRSTETKSVVNSAINCQFRDFQGILNLIPLSEGELRD